MKRFLCHLYGLTLISASTPAIPYTGELHYLCPNSGIPTAPVPFTNTAQGLNAIGNWYNIYQGCEVAVINDQVSYAAAIQSFATASSEKCIDNECVTLKSCKAQTEAAVYAAYADVRSDQYTITDLDVNTNSFTISGTEVIIFQKEVNIAGIQPIAVAATVTVSVTETITFDNNGKLVEMTEATSLVDNTVANFARAIFDGDCTSTDNDASFTCTSLSNFQCVNINEVIAYEHKDHISLRGLFNHRSDPIVIDTNTAILSALFMICMFICLLVSTVKTCKMCILSKNGYTKSEINESDSDSDSEAQELQDFL